MKQFTKEEVWDFVSSEFPDLEKRFQHPGWRKDVLILYPDGSQLNICADGEKIYMICMCLGKDGHTFNTLHKLSLEIKKYLSHNCVPWGG